LTTLALDLDGTLIDCRARQVAVAVHVAGPLDEDAFWSAKRSGATTADALAAQGANDPAAIAAAWMEQVEEERWLVLDRPLPGAAEALASVRAGGLAPVVLTARRHADRVRRQVRRLGLDVDRVAVVAPADAVAGKAHELARLGARGMIGDSETDLRAAVQAGVAFEAVGTGQRDPDFLRRHGAGAVHAALPEAVSAVMAALPHAT
jgi:phosphoglycolate phosphatase-like HAD superfamily hydrolase